MLIERRDSFLRYQEEKIRQDGMMGGMWGARDKEAERDPRT